MTSAVNQRSLVTSTFYRNRNRFDNICDQLFETPAA
jgi:hypothetical protein